MSIPWSDPSARPLDDMRRVLNQRPVRTTRILVTGSRDWTDEDLILRELGLAVRAYGISTTTFVHGHCPTGADAITDRLCRYWGLNVEGHPADWPTYGRAAGPRRNAEMVQLGAVECLAFILDDSRGATGCVELARSAGIPVTVHKRNRGSTSNNPRVNLP